MPIAAYDGAMNQAVTLLQALGDEQRLRIMGLLLVQSEGTCVCELVDALCIPQYQVSRQLSALRDAGLVSGEKRGVWVYYQVSPGLSPLAKSMLETLATHLNSDDVTHDKDRFTQRLALRKNGVCAVGYERGRPFRDTIPLLPTDRPRGGAHGRV
jgi:DNA-binding transcriptional ArsR family regulator